MKRIVFLFFLFACAHFSLCGQDNNVLFIVCDDLKYFDFESPDCPVYAPNLKALSESGIVFTNAHANNPICSPSRASFLSGTYAHNNGFFGYNQLVNVWYGYPHLTPENSIFSELQGQNYLTKISGKVYHGAPDSIFQNTINDYNKFGGHGPYPFLNNQSISSPHGPSNLESSEPQMGPILPMEGDSTWFNHGYPIGFDNEGITGLLPDELVRTEAVNFLNDPNHSKFIYGIGFYRPHLPFYAPQEFFDLYNINDIVIPSFLDEELLAQATSSHMNAFGSSGELFYNKLKDASEGENIEDYWIKKYLLAYYASISFVDYQLGLILEAFDQSVYAENTLLLLTSDNGFYTGEYEKAFNKNGLRNASSKIPFIVKHPDINNAMQIDQTISLIDLAPTLLDFATGESNPNFDGNSLLPLISSNGNDWDGNDYCVLSVASREQIPALVEANVNHQHYSLITNEYRLNSYANGEFELYDQIQDPFEKTNLAEDSDYAQVLDSLNDILLQEVACSRPAYTEGQILSHGGFEQDYNGWVVFNNGPNTAVIEMDGQSNEYARLTKNQNQTYLALENRVMFLHQDQGYKLKFKARASNDGIPLEIRMGYIDDNTPISWYNSQTISVDSEWEEYEIGFSYPHETSKRKPSIRFVLPQIGQIDLDDIFVETSDDIEPLDPFACEQNNFLNAPLNLSYSVFDGSIRFHWDSIPGSNKCEIQGNESSAPLQNNISWLVPFGDSTSTEAPSFSYPIPINETLDAGAIIALDTEYRWRVRCGCSLDPMIMSPFSGWEYFTLTSLISSLNENQIWQPKIYPNPNYGSTLYIEGENILRVDIFDMGMRRVHSEYLNPNQPKHQISTSLSMGNYIVKLQARDSISNQKLIIN
ncbi:MAG: sulfatase-like hydrolase/transferase [Bacteroidota bacterium]